MQRRFILTFAVLAATGALAPAAAADWPRFRGAAGDGTAAESGLPRSWQSAPPRELWRKPIGEGFSGIVTAGDRLFTMGVEGENEVAMALAPGDGSVLWRTPVGPKFVEEFGNGPRSTPAVDGDLVFVLGAAGGLHALRTADGSPVWQVNLVEALGARPPLRGFSPSPVVDGDLVLLEAGGSENRGIVAFDKATGRIRWFVNENRTGYSTPSVATIGGVRQYVFAQTAGKDIVGVAADGTVLWRYEWPNGPIAMPVFVPPNRVFVSTANDIGAVVIEIGTVEGKPTPKLVWESRGMKNHFSSSLHHDGAIYGFDNATLKCVDAATGELRWAQRGFGKGSLVLADGLLLVLSDRGQLVLAEATTEAFRELGRFQALNGKAWTSPSVAGGVVYVRDQDEIAAFDLRTARGGAPASPASTPGPAPAAQGGR